MIASRYYSRTPAKNLVEESKFGEKRIPCLLARNISERIYHRVTLARGCRLPYSLPPQHSAKRGGVARGVNLNAHARDD